MLNADSIVSVDVHPRVLPANATVRLRCTVPRHTDNRLLEYGVVADGIPVWSSQRDLEGESAPAIYTVFIDHVPCGGEAAYCAVRRVDGRWRVAQMAIEVSCP